MVDAAFAVHFLQSAASKDLISRPIQWAIVIVRWPCLPIIAHLFTAVQVLSNIHWLVGHSLTEGGITSRRNSVYLPTSSVWGPRGIQRGSQRYRFKHRAISLPPPVQILATRVQWLES
jgi:hypothetical protein